MQNFAFSHNSAQNGSKFQKNIGWEMCKLLVDCTDEWMHNDPIGKVHVSSRKIAINKITKQFQTKNLIQKHKPCASEFPRNHSKTS